MRNSLFIMLFFLNHTVQGQERKGFEEYYYPSITGLLPSLSSKLFYQGSNGWYTELRYNYENEQTLGCSIGKTFVRENTFSYSFTPAVGLVGGKMQGASIGLNTSLCYKRVSFSSFIQHTSCFEKGHTELLFSWSELNYKVIKHLSVGVAVQQTYNHYNEDNCDPGAQVSLSFQKWTFPFYLFKPANNSCYFFAGICHEW
jgi:hypothetical protein